MRILCCLNRDLASSVALNLLLPSLAEHQVRIGLTEKVGGTTATTEEAPERRALRDAEQTFPNEIFFPLIERAGLPDTGSRFLTFGEVERHRGIAVVPLPTPNSAEGLGKIEAFGPDLILTIRYGGILKAAAIGIPRLGVLNLHSGVLPEYRGMLATFRALMAGDREIGCTLHYISDGTIDTGAIVGIARTPVNPVGTLLGNILALYPPGIGMISEALSRLAAGESIASTPQPSEGGAYYTSPTPSEWATFTQSGRRVADLGELTPILRRYFDAPTPQA